MATPEELAPFVQLKQTLDQMITALVEVANHIDTGLEDPNLVDDAWTAKFMELYQLFFMMVGLKIQDSIEDDGGEIVNELLDELSIYRTE